MDRKRVFSGVPWEEKVGYCRAIRVGNQIEVSGTTAYQGEGLKFRGDAYGQTRFILERIQQALVDLGGSMEDVVRTRIYVSRIHDWPDIGRAHGEFFSAVQPATAMVEVSALIDPELLVEIEATAIVRS